MKPTKKTSTKYGYDPTEEDLIEYAISTDQYEDYKWFKRMYREVHKTLTIKEYYTIMDASDGKRQAVKKILDEIRTKGN